MVQEVYIHTLIFIVVNAALFAINWLTRSGDGSWWFVWPSLIWGTVLIIHVLATAACFRVGPPVGAPMSFRDENA